MSASETAKVVQLPELEKELEAPEGSQVDQTSADTPKTQKEIAQHNREVRDHYKHQIDALKLPTELAEMRARHSKAVYENLHFSAGIEKFQQKFAAEDEAREKLAEEARTIAEKQVQIEGKEETVDNNVQKSLIVDSKGEGVKSGE